MQLHTLKAKTKRNKSRQVGRGGTRGKTSGRGTKGQNARAGRKKRPELRDFIKRFPKLRGRGVSSFKSTQTKPMVVNLSKLSSFEAGATINPASFGVARVKILGTGELSKKFIFEGVETSASARQKIEKSGGTIK